MAKKGVKMHILHIKHTVQKINDIKAFKYRCKSYHDLFFLTKLHYNFKNITMYSYFMSI